jgi:phospholipase C
VDADLVDGKALLGCRVPTLIVSPFARGNSASPRINSLLYDHSSVLKLIEWRWGLEPLTARDASDEVANLASALNFSVQDTSVPALPVIAEPPVESCTSSIISGSRGTGGTVMDSAKAIELARTENSKGLGNESYDFYLLLKSERMAGWPLPAKLREK